MNASLCRAGSSPIATSRFCIASCVCAVVLFSRENRIGPEVFLARMRAATAAGDSKAADIAFWRLWHATGPQLA